ncbi:MAG TPA: Ig-like domain-containing protein [Elusimicrobiota bacterium]|nr:Ig-like domain-containing protein [Elusimicrobiota bacterium]
MRQDRAVSFFVHLSSLKPNGFFPPLPGSLRKLFFILTAAGLWSLLVPSLRADTAALSVLDGWYAASSATLSSLGHVTRLNTEDNGLDVALAPGKLLSAHKWIGVRFSAFTLPDGYLYAGVTVKFRMRRTGTPTEVYCDVSASSTTTKWSDAFQDNETGENINITTHTLGSANFAEFSHNAGGVVTSTHQVNSMEVLLRNADASPSVWVDTVNVEVTYTKAATVLTAETVDDDLDGKIDAYHVTFSTKMMDSSLAATAPGFAVAGYTNLTFHSTGTPAHADTADDADIYLRFAEGTTGDTGQTPDLTYSSSTGAMFTLSGYRLLNVASGDVTETDKAAPQMLSATASDASGGGGGIQAGDVVQIIFSENTTSPLLTSANINAVLSLSSAHTWLDASNALGSAVWEQPNILTVTLSAAGGPPTVAVGDTLTLDGATVKDAANNVSAGSRAVGGDFGSDSTPPVIASRETADLDSDGWIDAIHVTFNEKILDSSVTAADFDVADVTGESFASTTHGDTIDDADIYITFTDGLLGTDATPTVSFASGTFCDLSNNKMASSPATPSSDRAPPALLSAAADDSAYLATGIDGDDTVTLVFSEKTNAPTVDASNIDAVLPLSGGHTWKDGNGTVGGAAWNSPAKNTLTVQLSGGAGLPTVAVGDTLSIPAGLIEDVLGNKTTDAALIGGTFTGTDTTPPQILSVYPEDKSANTSVTATPRVRFSENMNADSARTAFTLQITRDRDGKNRNAAVSGATVFSSADNTLTFTPAEPLESGSAYQITVSTSAQDTIGNPLGTSHTSRFRTLLDSASSNLVVAEDEKSRVYLPSGATTVSVAVRIGLDPVGQPQRVDPQKIEEANRKIRSDAYRANDPLTGALREICLYDSQGAPLDLRFAVPATVSIPYTETGGFVDGTSPLLPEDRLSMYCLDETNALWVRIPDSSVNTADNLVTAPTPHFSVFGLFGNPHSGGNSDLYAFPVPFRRGRDSVVTFVGLPIDATVKIHTLSGTRVRTLPRAGGAQETWDLKNDDGDTVADGVYLYVVENGGFRATGKLLVTR